MKGVVYRSGVFMTLPGILLILAGVRIVFSLTGCGNYSEGNPVPLQKDLTNKVMMTTPERVGLPVKIEDGVTLFPDESGVVNSEVSGVLVKWYVEENQFVKKGDIVARLDATDYQLQYDKTSAELIALKDQFAGAAKEYQRIKTLYDKGAVAEQQYDGVETEYLVLKNKIVSLEKGMQLIRRNMEKTQIKAPFDGVITKKIVPLGKNIIVVMPESGNIAMIEKTDRLKADFYLSEIYYDEVDIGSPIHFYIPSLDKKVVSTIVSKGKSVNQAKQFNIIAYVDNTTDKIPAGVHAIVRIETLPKERCLISPSAIRRTGVSKGDIYGIKGGVVEAFAVSIGLSFEQGVDIRGDLPEMIIKDISGLKPGDQVTRIDS